MVMIARRWPQRAGFDSNSLWAITTPAGLRRFATCPNSAVGVICEPGALRSNPPFRRLNKKGHLHRWPFLFNWSGRQDLNLRPLHPQCSALPGCATPRFRGAMIQTRPVFATNIWGFLIRCFSSERPGQLQVQRWSAREVACRGSVLAWRIHLPGADGHRQW